MPVDRRCWNRFARHFGRRRSRTGLPLVVRFRLISWVFDYLDHHKFRIWRLHHAFGGRRFCLSRKVDDVVGLRSVHINIRDRRGEELKRVAGSSHHRDGRLVVLLKGPPDAEDQWDNGNERAPALINRLKEPAALYNTERREKNVSSTAPAWTCQDEEEGRELAGGHLGP